jgi:hypothetical protein
MLRRREYIMAFAHLKSVFSSINLFMNNLRAPKKNPARNTIPIAMGVASACANEGCDANLEAV